MSGAPWPGQSRSIFKSSSRGALFRARSGSVGEQVAAEERSPGRRAPRKTVSRKCRPRQSDGGEPARQFCASAVAHVRFLVESLCAVRRVDLHDEEPSVTPGGALVALDGEGNGDNGP